MPNSRFLREFGIFHAVQRQRPYSRFSSLTPPACCRIIAARFNESSLIQPLRGTAVALRYNEQVERRILLPDTCADSFDKFDTD